MKCEFLQNLKVGEEALPKEVIDAIMEENGRDITKAKTDAVNRCVRCAKEAVLNSDAFLKKLDRNDPVKLSMKILFL